MASAISKESLLTSIHDLHKELLKTESQYKIAKLETADKKYTWENAPQRQEKVYEFGVFVGFIQEKDPALLKAYEQAAQDEENLKARYHDLSLKIVDNSVLYTNSLGGDRADILSIFQKNRQYLQL